MAAPSDERHIAHPDAIGESQATAYTTAQRQALHFALGMFTKGCVVLEREPNRDHGWIEVMPTSPGEHRLAIWKHTGAVHTVDMHEAVSDDPIWAPPGAPVQPEPQSEHKDHWVCPSCAAHVHVSHRYCDVCSRKRPPDPDE